MTTTLHDLIAREDATAHATGVGSDMHLKMQRVSLSRPRPDTAPLIEKIKTIPGLVAFFGPDSRPEVPVAGTVNGRFISRRLDRLVVDTAGKTVRILDYKTDIDRTARRGKYIAQLREYATLMRRIYPGFAVECYILWLHDWTLEKITVA